MVSNIVYIDSWTFNSYIHFTVGLYQRCVDSGILGLRPQDSIRIHVCKCKLHLHCQQQ